MTLEDLIEKTINEIILKLKNEEIKVEKDFDSDENLLYSGTVNVEEKTDE